MTAKEPKKGLNLPLLEQKLDKALSNETEESLNTWLKEKRDKQETLEEAAEKLTEGVYQNDTWEEGRLKRQGYYQGTIDGAKWQQEQILDFLYSEITERRPYSSSKMCEVVIEFIEQLNTKK